jgi:hypothetical protein
MRVPMLAVETIIHFLTIEPQRVHKLSQAQQRRLYSSPNISQHFNLSIRAIDFRICSGHGR